MQNPYPEFTGDVMSGRPLRSNAKHTIWQQGSDAKEKEAQDLYEALKAWLDWMVEDQKTRVMPVTKSLEAIAKWEDK